MISTMVEHVGYHPVTASHFAEAIEILKSNPAALVLDLVMPDETSVSA